MAPPIATATSQATALSFIANILAQCIQAYQEKRPLTLNLPELVRFLLLSLITAPPNFLWQAWLERTFPGRLPRKHEGALLDDTDLAERGTAEDEKAVGALMGSETSGARLDKRNTLLKWFIDCMTVGALGNTIVFLVLMGFMKGRSSEQIFAAIKNDTIPIIVAGYKIWPIASIISFSLIPVEKRIVFLSAVGLCWGIYMSLVAARQ